jgi:hypothetical protein
VIAVTGHLPFAGAQQAVGVSCQEAAWEVAAGTTQATEGDLPRLRILHGRGLKQIVNTLIGSDQGQTIEELEAFWGQGAGGTEVHDSQGSFMSELQGQAGGEVGRGGSGPAAEPIPGSQAQEAVKKSDWSSGAALYERRSH